MATVKDSSGNTPSYPKGGKGRSVDVHIKSKQELIIEQLEIIATNTEA